VGRILREVNVRSDFSGARYFLERAFDRLKGSDRLSEQAREALGLLIEVMAEKEYSSAEKTAKILAFPGRASIEH
jgi:hypothetical protein